MGWWVLLHAVPTQHAFVKSVKLCADNYVRAKLHTSALMMELLTTVQRARADDSHGFKSVPGCIKLQAEPEQYASTLGVVVVACIYFFQLRCLFCVLL